MGEEEGDSSIEKIVATNHVLEEVLKLDNVLSYATTRGLKNPSDILDGYKLVLETLLRTILDGIKVNESLKLSENFEFYRARFVGINPKKVPPCCEKIIMAKVVAEFITKIRKMKSISQLESVIKEIHSTILKVDRYLSINRQLGWSLEETIKYLEKFYVFLLLNDLRDSRPWGSRFSMLPINYNKRYYTTAFMGYKYLLEYIWYAILGDDMGKYSLDSIHSINSWHDLDSFYRQIQANIISPIEDEYGKDIWSGKILRFNNSFDEHIFNSILSKPVETKMSEEDRLYYTLLWYPQYALLDSSKDLFIGTPLFFTILKGLVKMKEEGMPEKIYIAKIRHPDRDEKYQYSYGILIYVFGSFSDASGWIFVTQPSDFEMYNGEVLDKYLIQYEHKNYIETREMEISFGRFVDLLKKSEKTLFFNEEGMAFLYKEIYEDMDTREIIKNMRGINDELRGFAFEGMCYYIATKLYGDKSEVVWGVKNNKQEYDIVIKNSISGDIKIIECKTNINNVNLKSLLKKLDEKRAVYHGKKNKEVEIWTWMPPLDSRMIKEANVPVKIISEEIESIPNFRTRKLQNLMKLLGDTKEHMERRKEEMIIEDIEDEMNESISNAGVKK